MTDSKKWISHQTAERQRGETSEGERGRDSYADEQRAADERHERLLKIRMLETRIRATTASAKQREQKLTDERDAIAADALADVDTAHNDRLATIQEKYHGWVARFFMLGTGALLAFCGFWVVLFVAVIVIGIAAALIGFPI